MTHNNDTRIHTVTQCKQLLLSGYTTNSPEKTTRITYNVHTITNKINTSANTFFKAH